LIVMSYGPIGVVIGSATLLLSTVGAMLIAFSHSDKELKRHVRWTWREFKKFVTGN
jgi:hypothetical protein